MTDGFSINQVGLDGLGAARAALLGWGELGNQHQDAAAVHNRAVFALLPWQWYQARCWQSSCVSPSTLPPLFTLHPGQLYF